MNVITETDVRNALYRDHWGDQHINSYCKRITALEAQLVDITSYRDKQIGDMKGSTYLLYLEARSRRLDLVEAQLAWQPIETAPNDGITILLGLPVCGNLQVEDRRVYEGRWNEPQKTWTSINGFILLTDATHWMPLPEPPKASIGEIRMSKPTTAEIRERHETPNRNASGKLIFSDDLHEADADRGYLLDRIKELEAQLGKVRHMAKNRRCISHRRRDIKNTVE